MKKKREKNLISTDERIYYRIMITVFIIYFQYLRNKIKLKGDSESCVIKNKTFH